LPLIISSYSRYRFWVPAPTSLFLPTITRFSTRNQLGSPSTFIHSPGNSRIGITWFLCSWDSKRLPQVLHPRKSVHRHLCFLLVIPSLVVEGPTSHLVYDLPIVLRHRFAGSRKTPPPPLIHIVRRFRLPGVLPVPARNLHSSRNLGVVFFFFRWNAFFFFFLRLACTSAGSYSTAVLLCLAHLLLDSHWTSYTGPWHRTVIALALVYRAPVLASYLGWLSVTVSKKAEGKELPGQSLRGAIFFFFLRFVFAGIMGRIFSLQITFLLQSVSQTH